MSREHAIYRPSGHTTVASGTATWPRAWDPAEIGGPRGLGGLLITGAVAGRRRWTVTDSAGRKFRYLLVSVSVKTAFKRSYGADGREQEVSTGATTRKVSVGYLQSSFKSVAERPSDQLDVAGTRQALGTVLADLARWKPTADQVELWGEEDAVLPLDLQDGDQVRIKTTGTAAFIETAAKLNESTPASTPLNFSGSNIAGPTQGANWTDKLVAQGRATESSKAKLPGADMEGVAEEEWD